MGHIRRNNLRQSRQLGTPNNPFFIDTIGTRPGIVGARTVAGQYVDGDTLSFYVQFEAVDGRNARNSIAANLRGQGWHAVNVQPVVLEWDRTGRVNNYSVRGTVKAWQSHAAVNDAKSYFEQAVYLAVANQYGKILSSTLHNDTAASIPDIIRSNPNPVAPSLASPPTLTITPTDGGPTRQATAAEVAALRAADKLKEPGDKSIFDVLNDLGGQLGLGGLASVLGVSVPLAVGLTAVGIVLVLKMK